MHRKKSVQILKLLYKNHTNKLVIVRSILKYNKPNYNYYSKKPLSSIFPISA